MLDGLMQQNQLCCSLLNISLYPYCEHYICYKLMLSKTIEDYLQPYFVTLSVGLFTRTQLGNVIARLNQTIQKYKRRTH